MSSTKILWVSRHIPLIAQVSALTKIYGYNIEFVYLTDTLLSTQQIVEAYLSHRCADMVVVAPDRMFIELSKMDFKPLRSVVGTTEGEGLQFKYFERINQADIVTAKLTQRTLNGRGHLLWLSHILPTEHEISILHSLFRMNLRMFYLKNPDMRFDEIVKKVNTYGVDTIASKIRLWRLKKLKSMLPRTLFITQDMRLNQNEGDSDLIDKRGVRYFLKGFLVVQDVILDVEKLIV